MAIVKNMKLGVLKIQEEASPKKELSSVAEQFFQGNKIRSLKSHYGMSLYIAKKFIERHNGRINLSNFERLGGAKVILEFPSTL